MELSRCIEDRFSYRGAYEKAPVPREDLATIMRAGLAAPSGCNKQTTSLIAVDAPARVERMKALLNPKFALTAPAFICVLTKRICAYGDRCYAVHDYSAAIENMLLTIVDLGYASCWYEGYVTDEPNRVCDRLEVLLGVPEEYDLVCLLPVGIPAEAGRRVRKKPFEARAWFNGFGGVNGSVSD